MLDQLYREHHTDTLRILQGVIRPDHAAEDALMEAWTILARRAGQQPDYLEPTTIRGWLIVVARRAHLRSIRNQRRTCPLDLTFELADERAGIDAHLELAELVDAIRRLKGGRAQSALSLLLDLTYDQEQHATGRTRRQVDRGRYESRRTLHAQLS